jgi:hypothetical protein
MTFNQYPTIQPAVDIGSYVTQGELITAYNSYLGYQSLNEAPSYNLVSMNSNTWADGFLLASGVSQANINNAISSLESQSGLTPTGYENGSLIEPCFASTGVAAVPLVGPSENGSPEPPPSKKPPPSPTPSPFSCAT